ncbi:MAG: methylmalonyl Co-A mutase-associated GTPase MeaB [Chitinophagaceae bacterium]|nr:MAG: methylmalonyl Co-A mutase-associated GTPase MeaB [Chitinophagaceae bacterium]
MKELLHKIQVGDIKSIARAISLVENEVSEYENILLHAQNQNIPIIGITGPPGAGKSTLTDALIKVWVAQEKKIAVLCIDPSSPFNKGAILGDRVRMQQWYNHKNVFIRSLASRGSLGGLNSKIIEITDIIKNAPFDFIIVETVGVGQSEIEIAGLADVTVVVLVPEAGDEIQTMKAGLMEIADIFVVNKSDRPEAHLFVKNLKMMLAPVFTQSHKNIEIISTIADKNEGVERLAHAIEMVLKNENINTKKLDLLVDKAYQLIQQKRMKDVHKSNLKHTLSNAIHASDFNLYRFIKQYD